MTPRLPDEKPITYQIARPTLILWEYSLRSKFKKSSAYSASNEIKTFSVDKRCPACEISSIAIRKRSNSTYFRPTRFYGEQYMCMLGLYTCH